MKLKKARSEDPMEGLGENPLVEDRTIVLLIGANAIVVCSSITSKFGSLPHSSKARFKSLSIGLRILTLPNFSLLSSSEDRNKDLVARVWQSSFMPFKKAILKPSMAPAPPAVGKKSFLKPTLFKKVLAFDVENLGTSKVLVEMGKFGFSYTGYGLSSRVCSFAPSLPFFSSKKVRWRPKRVKAFIPLGLGLQDKLSKVAHFGVVEVVVSNGSLISSSQLMEGLESYQKVQVENPYYLGKNKVFSSFVFQEEILLAHKKGVIDTSPLLHFTLDLLKKGF